ncbi:MAG: hypothetical protein IPG35_18415 [Flavobacteriales bacterium]|nr:hypothetical protein [Flavobacteriales bacterium]
MSYDIGPQYPKDRQLDHTGFLEAARKHQSRFRAERLNLPFQNYGNFLTPEDAKAGRNFYPGFGVLDAAQRRYPTVSEKVYGNMLRSEHIPLNLFHPLNADDAFRLSVFSTLLNRPMLSVGKVEVEYVPPLPATNYLNDRTSFDAYFEYRDIEGRTGLVGIEVKYTEREYPLEAGSKQEREVNDRTTPYFKVMADSRIYREGCEADMITDEFRQIWRNQLLGESILLKHPDLFAHATLLTVFPEGNKHMTRACSGYKEFLTSPEGKFVALTYERFIAVCREYAPSKEFNDWLDYLQERYIVV